jgi:molybdate transport system regulatory protein
MKRPKNTIITGSLSLQSEGFGQFSEQQILLLQAINLTGSITKAAKKMGISYKTAWDRIETMNNLSITPLVKRSAGGARGGGTALTEKAEQIIAEFLQAQQAHSKLLQRIGGELESNKEVYSKSAKGPLQSNARNQLRGQIAAIVTGKSDSEISLNLGNSTEIVATITNTSRDEMKLEIGKVIVALIKSSWIILSKSLSLKTSARNNLEGTIVRLIKGDVNTEVIIDIGNEKTLCCIITNTSSQELELQLNDRVIALFKASSVLLLAD